ncbi:MAG TPA: restriction endonuclease, partial [Thermoguttaceae bacterium]|nr:restriction endonuclease [Thermoguttaceae bacterium]
EERIYRILERKHLLHQEVIEQLSEEDFEAALTIEDLLEILGMDPSKVRIPKQERKTTEGIVNILEQLTQSNPREFEKIVCEVFRQALGYPNARVVGGASDRGIDIEATKVVAGRCERIVVQCKRMEQVGPQYARELLGVLAADPSLTKGYLVTSGELSAQCQEEIRKSQGRLEGITGIQLARWIENSKIAMGKIC